MTKVLPLAFLAVLIVCLNMSTLVSGQTCDPCRNERPRRFKDFPRRQLGFGMNKQKLLGSFEALFNEIYSTYKREANFLSVKSEKSQPLSQICPNVAGNRYTEWLVCAYNTTVSALANITSYQNYSSTIKGSMGSIHTAGKKVLCNIRLVLKQKRSFHRVANRLSDYPCAFPEHHYIKPDENGIAYGLLIQSLNIAEDMVSQMYEIANKTIDGESLHGKRICKHKRHKKRCKKVKTKKCEKRRCHRTRKCKKNKNLSMVKKSRH